MEGGWGESVRTMELSVCSVLSSSQSPILADMIRKIRLFLVFWVGFAPTLFANAQVASLETLIKDAEIAGIAVVAITNGSVSSSQYAGVRSTETNPPITASTVFESESLSKPVLAYITLKLAGEKIIDLDTPLAAYASYPDAAADARYEKITARMVLTHTSGFPNWRNDSPEVTILFDPGLTFSYSGEGFVFLQRILEHLTGQSLEEMAHTHVFEPFKMTSSSFVWQSSFAPHIAVGHTDMGIALDKFTPQVANGAYTLHTTAADYAQFMLAVQRGDGLSKNLKKEMTTIQVDAGDGIFWGLGWGLQPTLSGAAMWEWGDNPGYKTFAYLTPNASKGFVMLSNSANGMLVLSDIFESVVAGPQTAVNWLNYENYKNPGYQLGRRMHVALLAGGIEEAKAVYASSKEDLPAEAFDELSLNSLGYRLLRQGLLEMAIPIFEYNATLYPNSANVHDSLGEAYYVTGRHKEALAHYRTSLRLDPLNQNGSAMVKTIEAAIVAKGSQTEQ